VGGSVALFASFSAAGAREANPLGSGLLVLHAKATSQPRGAALRGGGEEQVAAGGWLE